jgi:hypothetical protein
VRRARLLGHKRPGGGRRRARPRQDGRPDALRRYGWPGVSALDVRGDGRPRLLDTLRFDGWADELLLADGHLLVLSGGVARPIPIDGIAIRGPVPYPSETVIADVDVRYPAHLRVVRTLELDGSYLAARDVGPAVRLVLASPLGLDLPFVQPGAPGTGGDAAAATARNRDVVRSSGAPSWLPGFALRGPAGKVAARGRLIQCRQIARPRVLGPPPRDRTDLRRQAPATRSTRTQLSPTGASSARAARASTSRPTATTRAQSRDVRYPTA